MRMLPMIVALGLGAFLAMPAGAELRLSVQIGSWSGVAAQPRGVGAAWVKHRPERRSVRRHERRFERRFERRHERQRRHGGFLLPFYLRDYDRYPSRRSAPVKPVPPPPVVAAPAEPPPPSDPHGPLRLIPARGVAPVAAPYNVGEALPPGLPHVTLDWRHFDLPEPPPGQLYARVGRDVLLITAFGRIVERVLPPG